MLTGPNLASSHQIIFADLEYLPYRKKIQQSPPGQGLTLSNCRSANKPGTISSSVRQNADICSTLSLLFWPMYQADTGLKNHSAYSFTCGIDGWFY